MLSKLLRYFVGMSILLSFVLSSVLSGEIKEIKSEDLVGTETLNFYLSSTEERLIHYGDEYYGKYYLIITFFPAAFTPVWAGEMQGHEKQVALYDSLNARILGVSRDDVTTLKYWVEHLGVTFPVLSNISGYLGEHFGVVKKTQYVFERRTVIIDKKGVIRYASDGSPYYEDIISMLKKLKKEEG